MQAVITNEDFKIKLRTISKTKSQVFEQMDALVFPFFIDFQEVFVTVTQRIV